MFLKKKPITSNGSRNVRYITSLWYNKHSFKALRSRVQSFGGRNKSGRVTIWTKQGLSSRNFNVNLNYNHRSPSVKFIQTLKIVGLRTKLTALTFLASGGICYLPATDQSSIFQISHPPLRNSREEIRSLWCNPYTIILNALPRLSKVSLLELYPGKGVQYIRSSGSKGKLIKFDHDKHTVLVQLPSGVRKFFSMYSLGSFGTVALDYKKSLRNTKAGFYKNQGKKSKVRGVAMNPVDHPHGGRTKAIKYPRTPWGKTTKFK